MTHCALRASWRKHISTSVLTRWRCRNARCCSGRTRTRPKCWQCWATSSRVCRRRDKNLQGQTLAASLLVELCGEDTDKIDQVISLLIDRTKGAFIPLEYYDFDRQLARMLPDNLTLGRLCVPFDLISRTIMVACCNPFDAAGRAAVQQSLDYTVSWYLARPAAIERTLQDVYRLQPKA